ncbi:DUF6801 domain-containing protein [Streptomyces sp. SID10815]|uniref:DUF6801 domain-containing protein n=1 Tax=Streptomyces sp. SID10815 TaxID=2706027 RepID=UPI0013C807D3|nr:hypothetical protein [Streptomyces sp. SID10815]
MKRPRGVPSAPARTKQRPAFPRAAARRTAHVRARTATTAAFVVLAAMVPAAVAAAGTQQVDTTLPYVCTLPSGQRQATVRVSAAFPDRVAPGEAIRPSDVTTTVELPAEAVTDLKAPEGAGITAATRLSVGVAQNDATAEATWHGTAAPVAVPGSGPLTLSATGDVPSVTGQSAGDLTISAGNLAVDLAVTTTDGAGAGPAPLTVACTLDKDASGHGLLATVPVGFTSGGSPSSSPSGPSSPSGSATPSGSSSPSGQPSGQPGAPQSRRAPRIAGDTPGTTTDRDGVAPCKYDEHHPATTRSLDTYVTGYTNVRKQKAATLLPPSCTFIEQGDLLGSLSPDGSQYLLTQHSEGQFYYRQGASTAPFTATFLTFDFVPATATMVLEQTGPLTVDSVGALDMSTFGGSLDTYIRVPVVLHVTSLSVNGTPLDVGASCRTRTSLRSPDPDPAQHPGDHLLVKGHGEYVGGMPATGYQLSSGGELTGSVTIPEFTGCRTADGENVDRLLTASVSGPDNYVKQIQGQACGQFEPHYGTECTDDKQPIKIPVAQR